MANTFSALKRARQIERRTVVNRQNKARLRTALRKMRQALGAGDVKAAQQTFRQVSGAIDRMIQKGALHANTARRYKSRLKRRLNQLSAK